MPSSTKYLMMEERKIPSDTITSRWFEMPHCAPSLPSTWWAHPVSRGETTVLRRSRAVQHKNIQHWGSTRPPGLDLQYTTTMYHTYTAAANDSSRLQSQTFQNQTGGRSKTHQPPLTPLFFSNSVNSR